MYQPINSFPPSGTRDFFPQNMKKHNWLFNQIKKISESYGFEQYDAPIVEYANLFTRKGGDDILSEMYVIEDKEPKLALRPEITPSFVRMAIQKYATNSFKPLKWFSISQCWRYETTTRGRKREHYQWNMDIFGANNIKYELELFSIIIKFFTKVGLTSKDVTIHISNRKILQYVLNYIGVPYNLFEKACVIIDKISKLSNEDFETKLINEIDIDHDKVEYIKQLINVKNINDLTQFMPADNEILIELQQLFMLAEQLNIGQWLIFDPSIVRGLSYYTGIVFEGFFNNSEIKRSVCGGGRYDNLTQTYGYEKVPIIGFGFGDVVILDILEELSLLPNFEFNVDYVVVPFNDQLYPASVMISEMLREKNKIVLTYMKTGKRTLAFDYANKVGSEIVIYVAPDEWAKKQLVVKYLRETEKIKKQIIIDIDEFIHNILT